MNAAVLIAAQSLRIENRPPLHPAAHEALVHVTLAGVCGTDLAMYSGSYPVPMPLVPGHEFVGRVAEVGEGVSRDWVGKRVTAEINNTCLARKTETPCIACQSGLQNHCLERTVTGIIRHDGAFAQQIVVPAANLHAIPDSISDREAVLIEPLAAALQTFEMAPVKPNDLVVVLGAGRLGYLICGVAHALGAEAMAISRTEAKCRRVREWLGIKAQRMGSNVALVSAIQEWTRGLGASHVVEATGSTDPGILSLAVQLVRPRGVIDLKSTPGDFAPPIPLTDIVVNEVRLQGSRCGPFGKAIELMARKPFPIEELVDEEYPLSHASEAIERASIASKVVINCA